MIRDHERLDRVNDDLLLLQKTNGLTYGTDAFLLYAYMKVKPSSVAVDLGAGTGIISLLSLNKNKYRSIHAVEVQEDFADLIVRNAELNHLESRLTVHCADIRDFSAKELATEVEYVFSNPPYMKHNSGFLNGDLQKNIARHEMKGGIYDFCQCAHRLLKFGGSFYVVYRPDRLVDLMDALRASKLEPKRMTMVYNSVEHLPSLVLLEAKKGASSGMFVTRPLILTEKDGTSTETCKNIYENGVFETYYERP